MSRQNPERAIPHLRDIFGLQRQMQDVQLTSAGAASAAVAATPLNNNKSRSGNDSAVSVGGSASEEEILPKSKEKKKKQRRRDNARTLTERDVKHLERHLSMKKTIRKKIMRDLQQAFVEDPNEFRVEDIPPEKLKAEINVESLSFGPPSQKASPEANFLGMLRGNGNAATTPGARFVNRHDDADSGHGSPTRDLGSPLADCDGGDDDDIYESESQANKKTSFWRRFTMKGRNKR